MGMQITIVRKGKYSLEKYHMFLIIKEEIYMNEFIVDNSNPIFELIYQKL
jgi:hypothetical protein